MLKEDWLQHKVFIFTFLCELYESFAELVDGQPTWKLDNPIVWTPKLLKLLEESKYKVMKAFDY